MTEVKLKHYLRYVKKLEALAKAFRIKVVYLTYDSEGCYIPTTRTIKIDKDMSESAEISTLLHELGHLIDLTFMSSSEQKGYNEAYDTIYGKKYTKKHLEEVLRREIIAWENGRHIARELRIPLGKWYDIEAREALETYRKLAKK